MSVVAKIIKKKNEEWKEELQVKEFLRVSQ